MASDCSEPFTFGIALLPRVSAQNWNLVETLFGLTCASVAAQTDQQFRVLVAGHDRPRTLPDDSKWPKSSSERP